MRRRSTVTRSSTRGRRQADVARVRQRALAARTPRHVRRVGLRGRHRGGRRIRLGPLPLADESGRHLFDGPNRRAVVGAHEDSPWSIGAPRRTRLRMAESEKLEPDIESFPPEPIGQVRVRLLTDRSWPTCEGRRSARCRRSSRWIRRSPSSDPTPGRRPAQAEEQFSRRARRGGADRPAADGPVGRQPASATSTAPNCCSALGSTRSSSARTSRKTSRAPSGATGCTCCHRRETGHMLTMDDLDAEARAGARQPRRPALGLPPHGSPVGSAAPRSRCRSCPAASSTGAPRPGLIPRLTLGMRHTPHYLLTDPDEVKRLIRRNAWATYVSTRRRASSHRTTRRCSRRPTTTRSSSSATSADPTRWRTSSGSTR